MTEEEFSDLTDKAQRAHSSRAAVVRRAVRGLEVREAPTVDVATLIRDVRRVGYNINQLLKIANAQGLVDVPQLRKALDENSAVAKQIIAAYTVPGS